MDASRTLLLLAGAALLAWLVWLLRDVFPPFLIALALAVLLDPLLDRMQERGVRRGAAVFLTFSAFLALFVGALAFVIPRAVAQGAELFGNLDVYAGNIRLSLDRWAVQNADLLRRLDLPPSFSDLWQEHQPEILAYLQNGLGRLVSGLQEPAGRLGWLLVIPVVTLYLMMDLDPLRERVVFLLPPRHRDTVLHLSGKVGGVFMAYVRGLLFICFSYGLCVYVALGAVWALPYSVILGLLGAVLYAIPYLGQLTLLCVCAAVAWVTGRSPGAVAGMAVTLVIIGQLFDQLITPRVVGKQVGLHPVLGLFALMAGGQLFGLVGMVLAVPVAASVRVVLVHLFPRLCEPIPSPAGPVEPGPEACAGPPAPPAVSGSE